MMIRFFLVLGSEARNTQTTSSKTWTTGQLGGRTGILCSIWTEVTVLILALFSDFANNAMDITMMLTQVQIGQIILWMRQSLSTATLMSSTSSRCTTPLLTSGGDSFERSFLNLFWRFFWEIFLESFLEIRLRDLSWIFSISKFLPEASYRVGLTAEGYDADRVQVSTFILCFGWKK